MNNQRRITEIVSIKNSIKELRAEVHALHSELIAKIESKRDGKDGAQGIQGIPGIQGPAGRDASVSVALVGSARLQAMRALLESVLNKMAVDGE